MRRCPPPTRATTVRRPDFGRRAASYDTLRPADERWWERFELLVAAGDLRGRRILDVGCGTGALCAALAERARAKVWGIDEDAAMLAVARGRVPGTVGLKQARAEQLPFRDDWFERLTCSLVVHLLDRPAAFAEARRVVAPGGRLVISTFDPTHFGDFWLNRFFPSIEAVDRARFPDGEELRAQLLEAGFALVEAHRLDQRGTISRAEALAKIHGRHISTFDLLTAAELAEGTARAEAELPEAVEVAQRHLVVVASG